MYGTRMLSMVAHSLAALDAAWFTNALQQSGHASAPVTAVKARPLAFTGAVADMARFELVYGDDGEPGPSSLVAKIRGTSLVQVGMDGAMGLYARETRFYGELAGRVPVGTPRIFHIGDGTTTPLLMEDLGGLRPGDQMEGLSVPDAERIVDGLADMHAGFWDSPDVKADWLAEPAEGVYAAMIAQLVA